MACARVAVAATDPSVVMVTMVYQKAAGMLRNLVYEGNGDAASGYQYCSSLLILHGEAQLLRQIGALSW